MKTRYGWVEIDEVRYDRDVIIHRNRLVKKRSKKKSRKFKSLYGHTPLSSCEISFLKSENPDIVYIGTGQFNDLPITIEAHEILLNYKTIIRPTPEILEYLTNEFRPFVAVLHVTC